MSVTKIHGTNGSKPYGKPKPPHVVTAASTRAHDHVARMPHGKHDVRTLKVSGTGLPRNTSTRKFK